MSLVDLKKYLQQVRISSLSTISAYFNAEPDTLRQMLGHWIRKGCIKQCMKTPACATVCGKCSPLTTEIYEWVGN